jgi:hypothetical protein
MIRFRLYIAGRNSKKVQSWGCVMSVALLVVVATLIPDSTENAGLPL